MAVSETTYFEHLFKEYAALTERLDTYAKSSFEDFKLLAVAGLVLAWPPLSEQLTKESSPYLLLMGFIVILLVIATIDARDNLKHSVVRFYMSQAKLLEEELLSLAGKDESRSFHVARNWDAWLASKHFELIVFFQILVYSIAVIIPAVTLIIRKSWALCLIYLAVAATVGVLMYFALRILRR